MMTGLLSPHISDDLPRLLTGDATREEVLDAAEHLRTCPDCQQELVSAVVAHASLTSAYRFAEQVVVGDRDAAPPEPPVAEPSGRHAATDSPDPEAEQAEARQLPLPDLSGLFAQLRTEAGVDAGAGAGPDGGGGGTDVGGDVVEPGGTGPAIAPAPQAPPVSPAPTAQPQARPQHRRRWVVSGLAAAVIAGGGITAGVIASNSSNEPSGQNVALQAFDVGKNPADLRISGSTLKIDASKLSKPSAGQVYEVWLTDTARKNLAAIGTLGTDNKATLTVTPSVRSNFTHVEVSVQKANKLDFSGVSVLRGDYS